MIVEDYAYAGTDFRDNHDVPLPEDDQWDE